MRQRIAAVLLFLVLIAAPVRAAFTSNYDAVRAKFVALRGALVEPLSARDAELAAAVDKLVAKIDASDSLQKDAENAKFVVGIGKAFRLDPDLPGLVLTLARDLRDDVVAHFALLTVRMDALSASRFKTRAGLKLEAAQAVLAVVETASLADDARRMAFYLEKAMKQAGPTEKFITKGENKDPLDCLDAPGEGALVVVAGTGGFHRACQSLASVVPVTELNRTQIDVPGAEPGERYHLDFAVAIADMHLNDQILPTVHRYERDGLAWELLASSGGGEVKVVAETPTSVTLCLDHDLPAPSGSGQKPDSIGARGYVVVAR